MSQIEFELFAPYNESVSLCADFNGWEPSPMTKGDDGVFRLAVELEDGTYHYRFTVASKSWFYEDNQKVDVTDPGAWEIVDDEFQNAVVHIVDGQKTLADYEWRNDEALLVQTSQLIIYELLVHDFPGIGAESEERGTFAKVAEKLDYFNDLGITAIEFLPIEEYPGRNGWGYNPRHFFAPESSYGSPADLMKMIDDCHGRGIRIFKDGVYNHAETSTPIAQIDHDYWFHHDAQDQDQNWGPEFNYEKYDEGHEVMPSCKFVGDVLGHWIDQYHLDGIRFDAVAQMNNFDVLRHLDRKGHEISDQRPFTTIAEYMPPDPSVIKPSGPVDACWNIDFHYAMKEMLWQGQEFGNYTRCLQEPTPVDWSLLGNPPNQDLHNLYKTMIRLRKDHTALQGSDLEFFHVHEGLPVVAYLRWNGDGGRVVTIVNFSDQFLAGYALTNLPEDGDWKDWINDDTLPSSDHTLTFDLAEWEARVFVL